MINQYDADEVFQVARELAMKLSCFNPVMFVFSNNYRLGSGGVRRFDSDNVTDTTVLSSVNETGFSSDSRVVWFGNGNPRYVLTAGVGGLYSGLDKFLLSYDTAMASMLVSMLHEMRHVFQYEVAAGVERRPGNMPVEALYSLVAACDNKDMYLANYEYMPHEIDAEYVGVMDAFDLLCEGIGQQRAIKAMSSALHRSSVMKIGPIRHFDFGLSFDYNLFSVKSSYCMRTAVDSFRNIETLSDAQSCDFASKYLSLNKQDFEMFKLLEHGFDQDIYLAKINVKYNEKVRGFFDRLAMSFPMNSLEPCGGLISKPLIIRLLLLDADIDEISVVSDITRNDFELG